MNFENYKCGYNAGVWYKLTNQQKTDEVQKIVRNFIYRHWLSYLLFLRSNITHWVFLTWQVTKDVYMWFNLYIHIYFFLLLPYFYSLLFLHACTFFWTYLKFYCKISGPFLDKLYRSISNVKIKRDIQTLSPS